MTDTPAGTAVEDAAEPAEAPAGGDAQLISDLTHQHHTERVMPAIDEDDATEPYTGH